MANIKTWSTTAASNNSASPDGFPEAMAPSGVNDSAREVMAAVRTQCEDMEWFDWNDTPTYVSATSFTITGDVTSRYVVNRKIKCTDSSTLYGYITSSSYSDPDTTVNVTLYSGSLSGSLSAVALFIISPASLHIDDNDRFYAGNAGDVSLYHTGTLSALYNITGDLFITEAVSSGLLHIKTFDSLGGSQEMITVGGTTPEVILLCDGVEQLKTTPKCINLSNVPTSAAGLMSGDIWSNSGVLTIV